MAEDTSLASLLKDALKDQEIRGAAVAGVNLLTMLTFIRSADDNTLAKIALTMAAHNPAAFFAAINSTTINPYVGGIGVRTASGSYFRLTAQNVSSLRFAIGPDCNKIAGIKEFRAITDAGLKDAKDCVEYLSWIKVLPGNFYPPIDNTKFSQTNL